MKVAILIPTLNRKDFLLRTLKYYSLLKSIHPIYIGDASSISMIEEINTVVRGRVVVHYFHWPGLSDRDTIKKLAQKASVDCEYCAFQGDDDFFVPNSLSICAEFLSNNDSFRTAQGNAAVILLDRPGAYGNIKALGPYWNSPALHGSSGTERLKEITENYWVPNFSVHRTIELIADFTDKYPVKDRYWGELTNTFSCAINGKSKFIDIFYLIRNVHDGIDHQASQHGWRESQGWDDSFSACKLTLSEKLRDNSGDVIAMTRLEVQFLLDKYLARTQIKWDKILRSRRQFGIIDFLRHSRVSPYLRRMRDFLICSFFMTAQRKSDMRYIKCSRSKYFTDFLPVITILSNK